MTGAGTGMTVVPKMLGGHPQGGATHPGLILLGEDVESCSSLGAVPDEATKEVAHVQELSDLLHQGWRAVCLRAFQVILAW